jgi:hypothetical protein
LAERTLKTPEYAREHHLPALRKSEAVVGGLTWRAARMTDPGLAEARALSKKKFDFKFRRRVVHPNPDNANMELLPAHPPLLEDDTDEELNDQQVRELLNEAAIRMRAKAAGKPTSTPDVPFKLPKLRPGHIADTHESFDGNITRLDYSKLIDTKLQALANGIKKIDDPLAVKRQKKMEVCTFPRLHSPVMIIIPISY